MAITDKKADLAGPGIGNYEDLEKVLPSDYEPILDPRETMIALFEAKNYIEKNIKTATGDQRKELQEQRLRLVAEVRKQLGLLLDIAQALYNAEEVAAFQKSVLEEIGHAAPEVRDRILHRLNERRAIRSTFGFGQPGV
jgi:hypothetical protein